MGNSSSQTDTAADRHDKALAKVSSLVDRQLSPLGRQAINALDPKPGEAVLDVGCGAGQTLIQIAERVGTFGSVTAAICIVSASAVNPQPPTS